MRGVHGSLKFADTWVAQVMKSDCRIIALGEVVMHGDCSGCWFTASAIEFAIHIFLR